MISTKDISSQRDRRSLPTSSTIFLQSTPSQFLLIKYLLDSAMTMDPEMFPEPESFKPERFIDKDGKVIDFDLTFGFGRRVCPGRHVAWQSVYIVLTR